jgi:hypothetical protein
MHLECAQLAMQQCPFLAGRDAEGRENPVLATYAHNMVLWTATAWRWHRDRLGHLHFQATRGLMQLHAAREEEPISQ